MGRCREKAIARARGGARMWMEETLQAVNMEPTQEALDRPDIMFDGLPVSA